MLRILPIILIFAAAAGAQAQDAPGDGARADARDWSIVLGAGLGARPTYRGSDSFAPALFPSDLRAGNLHANIDQVALAMLPFVSFDYDETFYFESDRRDFGVRYFDLETERYGRYQASLVGHYEHRRNAEDDDALRGLEDVSRAFFVGGRFTYSYDAFTLRTAIGVDVTEQTDGAIRGDATLTYDWSPDPRWTVRPRLGIELGDGSYNDAYFGVSESDAARSRRFGVGLDAYNAPAGLTAVSLGLDVDYAITERFGVTGFATYERLAPAAADSPLVEDVGSANQLRGGVMLTYTY